MDAGPDRLARVCSAVMLLIARAEKVSIRNVAALAKVRWQDVAEDLKALPRDPSGNYVGNALTRAWQRSGNARATTTRAARITKESLQPTNGKISNTLLPTVGVAADAATLPEWAERIQTRVRALGRREHRTLDHHESFDAAALFAIRFMSRKNRTEEAVRGAALGLIGRMRNVVTNKDHPALHDLTVREFFGFAKEAWEAGGRQDLATPWVVVAYAEAPEKTA